MKPLFGGFSPMAVYCAVGAIRCVMADDVDAQSDDDGGRWARQPPKDGCIIVAQVGLPTWGWLLKEKIKYKSVYL